MLASHYLRLTRKSLTVVSQYPIISVVETVLALDISSYVDHRCLAVQHASAF